MPFRFICAGCGHVLGEYQAIEDIDFSHHYSIAEALRSKLGNTCPKSGKLLKSKPISVRVLIVNRKLPLIPKRRRYADARKYGFSLLRGWGRGEKE